MPAGRGRSAEQRPAASGPIMNGAISPGFLLAASHTYHFALSAVPPALTSAIVFILGALVFIRQPGSRPARLFAEMLLLVAMWFFCFAWMYSAADAGTAEVWAKIGLAAVAFIPPAVYQFTVTVLRIFEERRVVVALSWVTAAFFAIVCLATDTIVSNAAQFRWGYYPRLGWFGPVFLAFIGLFLAVHLFEYVREQFRADLDSRRSGVRKLMISFLIAYLSAIDFLPMFGVRIYPFGFFFVLGFLAYAGRSIRRHRLGTITPARAAREILDTMADVLIVCDADGRIRVVNGAVRSLFGYNQSELLGRSIEFLDLDESFPLRNLLNRGTLRDVEMRLKTRSGEGIDVSVSVSPLSERETEGGAVMIARDIRERKKAEQEHGDFILKLQQSNRELEEFAHVASHDLQEPLRKIQAFGDRLRAVAGDQLPPEGLDYLERMQSAGQRMQTLITDLLTFSRVTTTAQAFEPVSLTSIVDEVLGDLEVRINQNQAHIDVGTLPSIEADPLQMRQLFQNLLSNAMKFRKRDV
jgi:PAS domain S-box-containing protein